MKPLLGVAGSSWAAGYRIDFNATQSTHKEDRTNAWPKLVADNLNFNLFDESRSGASISRVFRKTIDMLLSNKFSIIIVELSRIDWYELGSSTDGKIMQIRSLSDLPINKLILTEYYNSYLFYTNMLRQIISLQCLAEKYQTPLYFIDISANIIKHLTLEKFIDSILVKHSELFNALDDDMIVERYEITAQLNRAIDYSKFLFQSTLEKHMLSNGATKKHFDTTTHPSVLGQKMIADLILEELGNKYETGNSR